MPTVNQLVRKGRKQQERKAKVPALLKGWNSKKREAIDQNSPQKRGVLNMLGAILLMFIQRSKNYRFRVFSD